MIVVFWFLPKLSVRYKLYTSSSSNLEKAWDEFCISIALHTSTPTNQIEPSSLVRVLISKFSKWNKVVGNVCCIFSCTSVYTLCTISSFSFISLIQPCCTPVFFLNKSWAQRNN